MLGRSATSQFDDPLRVSVVVNASYPGASIITVELSFGSSILAVPSDPVVAETWSKVSMAPEICCPEYRSVTRTMISGLADNLGTRRVNRASTIGTAKTKMLTGHVIWLHSRLLFDGSVR
jgi:hypothetical protein